MYRCTLNAFKRGMFFPS